jgi:predicted metal-dependent enzyme (double-stranded beta helix superfamily)
MHLSVSESALELKSPDVLEVPAYEERSSIPQRSERTNRNLAKITQPREKFSSPPCLTFHKFKKSMRKRGKSPSPESSPDPETHDPDFEHKQSHSRQSSPEPETHDPDFERKETIMQPLDERAVTTLSWNPEHFESTHEERHSTILARTNTQHTDKFSTFQRFKSMRQRRKVGEPAKISLSPSATKKVKSATPSATKKEKFSHLVKIEVLEPRSLFGARRRRERKERKIPERVVHHVSCPMTHPERVSFFEERHALHKKRQRPTMHKIEETSASNNAQDLANSRLGHTSGQ